MYCIPYHGTACHEGLMYFETSCESFDCHYHNDWSNAMLEMSWEFFSPLSDNNSLSSTFSSFSFSPLSWQGVMHARAAWFTVTRLVLVAKATSATVTSSASLTSPSRSLGSRRFFDQCCDVARVDYIVGLWQVLQQAVKVIAPNTRSNIVTPVQRRGKVERSAGTTVSLQAPHFRASYDDVRQAESERHLCHSHK